MRPCAGLATIAGFAVCKSLGGAVTDAPLEADTDRNETKWEFSLSSLTYLAQHERDYANPNFTADYDGLHLEARYNYEALKTGSVWIGYNFPSFSIGRDLEVNATPMLGGIFWRHHGHRASVYDCGPLRVNGTLCARRVFFRCRNEFRRLFLQLVGTECFSGRLV
jgi:hypothetical protein